MIKNKTIPIIFWLYLPIMFLIAQLAMEKTLSVSMLEIIHSENGSHELLQAFISGIAFFIAIFLLRKLDWQKERLVASAVLIAALGCFYITGEELSWGQHFVLWSTPEFWAGINDQSETNLHNTSDWLDQKPRLLLFFGIVVGGLVVPWLRRYAPHTLPVGFHALYPSNFLIPTSLGVILPYIAQKITDGFDARLFIRVSEVQEIYMYYFVLLYLVDLYNREIFKD